MPKAEPHIFGPHSHQYFLDTLEMEREQNEREAALQSVYGPPKPGEPEFISTLWTDRYYLPPTAEGRRIFLKWFHEKYPPLWETTSGDFVPCVPRAELNYRSEPWTMLVAMAWEEKWGEVQRGRLGTTWKSSLPFIR